MAKVIFHIDLNAFFANAEILKDPSLKGKPVVVAGFSKRSVISTASYEARKFGVHSAMPMFQAYELCPDLIVVKGDYKWYEECSRKFIQFIKKYSPLVEIASIDECYVNMTNVIKKYERPLDLAWEIQNGLYQKLGLPCSIGIAPNKFLAKMASDMRKPMGITVLRKQEVKTKLWPLSIKDMFGIGKKTAPLLIEKGIETIGDLANPENEAMLLAFLGKHGPQLIQNARGNGNDELTFSSSLQSISQSTTINHDVEEYSEIKNILRILTKSLCDRAISEQIKGKLISVSIRYYDFRNVIRSTNINTYVNDFNSVFEQVMLLFDQNYEMIPIRHLGVGLGSLISSTKEIQQLNIFQEYTQEKVNVLDELNKQITGSKLMYASNLLKKTKKD